MPGNYVGPNPGYKAAEMNVIHELEAADRGEIFIEQFARRFEVPRARKPLGGCAARGEADHFSRFQKRNVAGACRSVSKAESKHAFDITLHHGRLRVQPERIDE